MSKAAVKVARSDSAGERYPYPEQETIAHLFASAWNRTPMSNALVTGDTEHTYGDLGTAINAWRHRLSSHGIGPGERVGLLLDNCGAYQEVLVAVASLSATVVPLNSRLSGEELAYVIADAALAVIVTDCDDQGSPNVGRLNELVGRVSEGDPKAGTTRVPNVELPLLRAVLSANSQAGQGNPDDLAGRVAPSAVDTWEFPEPTDVGMILYTSGTTSKPKGCQLTHRALVRNAVHFAEWFEMSECDRMWNPLPMFHTAMLVPMMATWYTSSCLMTARRFSPANAIEVMASHQATVLYSCFPTVTLDVIHHSDFCKLPESIRIVCNLGSQEIQRRVRDAFPRARLTSAYGLTEAAGPLAYNRPEDPSDEAFRSCGHPFHGIEVGIRGDDGAIERSLPSVKGELCVRGYAVFLGYLNDVEKTASVMERDGWLRTGDLCSLDGAGRIVYWGRLKDMLKVGGENVAAVEVESVLNSLPEVKFAQVVGVSDPRLEEVPAAFVETAADHHLTEELVINFCRQKLADFKVPRHVRFVREWPTSATKVQKFKLREWLEEELRSQGRV